MTFDPIDFGERSDEPRRDPAAKRRRSPPGGRRTLAFAIAAIVVAASGATLVVRAVREPPMDEAVQAFRDGRYAAAAAAFRRALDAGGGNVTAYLYLARIDRRRQAYEEAASSLRAAARLAPDDPDVNRELGYLFLDLGRPGPAVRRFELALEVEPDADPNWIGLVRALRAARDPRAEFVLRRAPDTVRALLVSRG